MSAPRRRPGWGRHDRARALALALAIAACAMIPVRGYLTDDTFIHLQYARHLASGAGPVFNVGERVYGCTSPLWMALIALGIRLGADGLAVAKALGGAATLASVALCFQLARQTCAARGCAPSRPSPGRQRVDDPLSLSGWRRRSRPPSRWRAS